MNPSLPNRRFFLKSTAVTLALPLMESLSHKVLGAGLAVESKAGKALTGARPMRMVAIGNALGFYQPAFFPKNNGANYDLPHLLKPLAPHQSDLTLFSGLDHGHKGGHFAIHGFLSGVRTIDAKGMPDGNITIDQRAAETIAGATRFASIAVGSEDGIHGGCLMSWTRSGVRVPPIATPSALFDKLFRSTNAKDIALSQDRMALQGSILDAVNGDAKSLRKHLGKRDQEKLEEYFTSVRDVEKQLETSKRWLTAPTPEAGIPAPTDTDFVSDLPVLYDLIALALQTDSTRIATLEIAGGFNSAYFNLKKDWHALSHHGQVQENISGLLTLELYQMEQFARFIAKLKSIQDGDGTLLDHSMVLFGSGMGNANAHTNVNLPIILAGGGFKHGEHRAYGTGAFKKQPLCNLYVTMLQKFGVETSRFGLGSARLTDFA